jgi:histidine triad (HIT) family protein
VASGRETDLNRRSDVVLRDDETTAFVSPRWWEGNPGHVIVVPSSHFPNLYEIPDDALGAVYATAQRVAVALKEAYGCQGTSTRQHNDGAAGQEVWHFHVHVFPRYENDRLYARDAEHRWTTPEERAPYAERLREALR